MNTAVFLPLAFVLGEMALVGVVFHFLPVLARPDIFFAVTVRSGFSSSGDGRRILARYRAHALAATLLGASLLGLALAMHRPPLAPAGPALQVVGVLAAFVAARSRVGPHAATPSPLRVAELVPRRARLPGGWLAQLGPFALLAGASATLALRWHAIPDRFAVHWNVDLQPDRWVTRTPGTVFAQPILGAMVCAIAALTAYGALRWSRRVDGEPARSAHENRFRWTFAWTLVVLEYAVAALYAWIALQPLRGDARLPWPFFALLFLVLAVAVGAIVLLARRRIDAATVPTAEERPGGGQLQVGDRTPDACWKLGMFYVNPSDPALFVERRFALGYTLNFGNPWAWGMAALVAALVCGAVVLLR